MNICYSCFKQKSENEALCPFCGYDSTKSSKYPHALKAGTVLGGKYILGRVLGQGGFGITYIAQDYQSKELVAIKEYFPEAMATRTNTTVATFSGQYDENFEYGKQCFLEEAKTLAEFIGNPNIVRVYSFFEENGTAYFAMEYVQGTSLKEYLDKNGGKISYEEAKWILLPIMDALADVHAKGIIHRDISPDNIFITKDKGVKLIDFGAARYSIGDKSKSLDVILKHGYAPKEQYTRRGRQGAYTDVYALAATFYRAITGHIPPDSIERIEDDNLVEPNVYGIKIPEEAEAALMKALELSHIDRFQTMGEFKNALVKGDVASQDRKKVIEEQRKQAKDSEQKDPEVQNQADVMSSENATEAAEKPKRKNKKLRKILLITISSILILIVATFGLKALTQFLLDLIDSSIDTVSEQIYEEMNISNSNLDFKFENIDGILTITEYTGDGGYVIVPQMDPYTEMVYAIGADAFRDNDSITGVSIPGYIYYIDEHAFAGCDSLKTVSLPHGYTAIHKTAFEDCVNIETVYISDERYTGYFSDGPIAEYYPSYMKETECIEFLEYLCPQINNLKVMYESASPYEFRYSLVDVGGHKAVQIDEWIPQLTYALHIPDKIAGYPVEIISLYAFSNKSMYCLYLPERLSTIEKNAFSNTNINSVYINKNLKTVYENSFSNLESIEQCYYYGDDWDSIKHGFGEGVKVSFEEP